jgi:hypothetical protein
MTQQELNLQNARIKSATQDSQWGDTKLLGLFVVGRLAARRGIQVHLEPSAGRGLTANVLLPAEILSPLAETSTGSTNGTIGSSEADRELDQIGQLAQVELEPLPEPVVPVAGPVAPTQLPTPVAPAARRPELVASGSMPTVEPPADHSHTEPQPSAAPAPAPVPTRVRGAQLPDLGPDSRTVVDLTGFEQRPGIAQSPPTGPIRQILATATQGDGSTAQGPPRGPFEPARPAVPTRVRGAQLGDLGLIEGDSSVSIDPSPDSTRWKLRSFQLDVAAARRGGTQGSEPNETGERQ